MKKRALVVSAIFIAGILLFNLGKFADIEVERSRMSSGETVGISGLELSVSESSSNSENSADIHNGVKTNTAGNGSGSGSGEYAPVKEVSFTKDEAQAQENKEAVTEPQAEEDDEAETDPMQEAIIGYITCPSANLNNAEITCSDNRQNEASPDYFGVGHSVFLSGDNYDSLSGLHNVSVGDTITINSTHGEIFAYRVTYSSAVYSSNNQTLLDMATRESIAELNGASDVLQICSCADDFENNKYLVKAELVQNTTAA